MRLEEQAREVLGTFLVAVIVVSVLGWWVVTGRAYKVREALTDRRGVTNPWR